VRRTFRCYARGHYGSWEAICTDLDIAVQGRSLPEVKRTLERAVLTYVEDAKAESPAVARRLLSRRAPLPVRARLRLSVLLNRFRSYFDGDAQSAKFKVPCPA